MTAYDRLPDLIPVGLTPSVPSRRGGRRPGAGAPTGNLNALKHGRRSRFKNALPVPPLSPVAVARAVLLREQREVERVAASFLRLTLYARYCAECAAAVAAGLPLPDPPLSLPTAADLARVTRYGALIGERNTREQQRRDGRLDVNSASVRADLEIAARIDLILPKVAALLERASRRVADPADLARLLAVPTADNQTLNQPAAAAAERGSASGAARCESGRSSRPRRAPPP